jgi:choline-sulfatase
MITRRQLLMGGTAGLVAPGLALGRTPHNAVVVMVDEHNPLYSQPYGHPFVRTPNLERLAGIGTVFTNAYCPSPLCMPSRSAFLSGRRVFDLQTYSNCNVFVSNQPCYGKVMADQGVHTVHIGKVDAYNHSSTFGFSEMIRPGDRARPGDVNVSRNPLDTIRDAEGRSGGYGIRSDPFRNQAANVDAALKWLAETAPRVTQPWTLVVNIEKPHFPHYVTRDLWDLYAAHADLPNHGVEAESARHPYALDLRKFFGTDRIGEEQTRSLRRGYYGCVTWVDSQVGRLLDALEGSGWLGDTVLAYTSDHGEMLGKFGMWWKRSLYEDSVRIPMIVAGPGFGAGRRVETPVDLHDLQAAMFHATGARRPREWCGRPLQSIGSNDARRVLFSEFQGGGTRAGAFMIRQGRWKLIYNCAAPHQLFDLVSDPDELANLAPRRDDIAARLEKELRRICDPEKENRRAEEYAQRQLRAVGRRPS